MKLGEILKSIDARRPNALEEDTKICFINSTIRQYGKIIGKGAVYEFETEEGKNLYKLPDGEEGDGIVAVFIGEAEAECLEIGEEARDNSYIIMPAGFIRLSGTGAKQVKIIHNACVPFETFDGDDYLEADCGAYDSFADVLVYGALYQMAESEEDLNAATNYKEQMMEILKRAQQGRYLKRGRYPKVKARGGKWHRF